MVSSSPYDIAYEPEKLPDLIESALSKSEDSYSLEQLNELILSRPTNEEVDALITVPLLLSSTLDGSESLLETIGARCSAREALIAIQEAVERLERASLLDEDVAEEEEESNEVPNCTQLVRILHLYAVVLPRLQKRTKTPTQILQPLMFQVQAAVPTVTFEGNARNLIRTVPLLVAAITDWIGDDEEERGSAAAIVYDLLREILRWNANNIHAGLVVQAFKRHYPRLQVPDMSAERQSEDRPKPGVSEALDALRSLGFQFNASRCQPSISTLILIAHSSQPCLDAKTLEAFFPIILSAVQTNTALDEVLAVLLDSLGHLRDTGPRPELPIDLIVPFIHLLAPLASAHPEPAMRHATYKIISIVLVLSPSLIRMTLLRDLITDEDEAMQYMRVAAIGLVKEALLEALSKPSPAGPPNPFTSPLFMQEIGSILFIHQADTVASTLGDFLESSEPLRLVESLGLLYLLLLRDVSNSTGVRDRSFLKEVERTLLNPLKERLTAWGEESMNIPNIEHAEMQLGIIDMWLDRLSAAIVNVSDRTG